MKRLFTQFSFPGGIPSHVAPETPGSIHEGGELGYALSHAYGAAFDNPDLIVACVVGDGEAGDRAAGDELAFQQVPEPGDRRRGPADPAPQRLQDRQSHHPGPHQPRGAGAALSRLRLHALFRRGRRPGKDARAHGRHAGDGHRRDPRASRRTRATRLRRTPALADDRAAHAQGLDLPQGDRRQAHRGLLAGAPGADGRDARKPEHVRILETVDEELPARRSCSTTSGRLRPELAELAPEGDRRMSANPHANGGAPAARPAACPISATTP